MGFFDKFIPKEVKKPFKVVGKLSKKFLPKELRPWLPMASAFMPYTGIMGAMGGPMGFGKMYLTSLLAQQMADPEAEFDDLNQLSALLSGTHGGLMGKDTAANLRGMQSSPMRAKNLYETMGGPGLKPATETALKNRGFWTKAGDLGLEGLAEASEYLQGGAETLGALGSGEMDLFTKAGAIEGAKAGAVPFAKGMGDVTEAYQRPAIRDWEAADAAERAEIEATTTANESDRAYWSMRFMREAGHDEETVKETLEQNDLGEYYEPPVEEAAQGGIIGLKEGGSVNTPKRGLVDGPGGYAGEVEKEKITEAYDSESDMSQWRIGDYRPFKYTGAVDDMWKLNLDEGSPLEYIFKIGMTVRAPLIDVIRGMGKTAAETAKLIAAAGQLGWDLTKPAREILGAAGAAGLEGTKWALGHSDKFRFAQKPYLALRMTGMSDDEARLKLQDTHIGDFRKDPELIKALQTRLFEDKIGYGSDYQGGEVELYPGQSTKYAQGGIIGLKHGGMLNFGGREMDLRGGGFVPIGKKERADDVPARLSKNEFVMTADAVRAAGGGDVNKGAQRMYNVMNNLEARA